MIQNKKFDIFSSIEKKNLNDAKHSYENKVKRYKFYTYREIILITNVAI